MEHSPRVLAALLIMIFAMGHAIAGADEPIKLRFRWGDGDAVQYRFTLRSEARGPDGARLLSISLDQTAILAVRALAADGTVDAEYRQGNIETTITVLGREVRIAVGRDEIVATMDGRPLLPYQYAQLRREAAPLQSLMRSPARLRITDTGKVVEIRAPELDERAQRELALALIDNLELPTEELRVGQEFTQHRAVAAFFPRSSGGGATPPTQKVAVSRKLTAVEQDASGARLARIHTRFAQPLLDVSVALDGSVADVIPDLDATSWFDLTRGRVVKEQVSGTVRVVPKNGSPAVTLFIRGELSLME